MIGDAQVFDFFEGEYPNNYAIQNDISNFLIEEDGITFNVRYHNNKSSDIEDFVIILTNDENYEKLKKIDDKSGYFNSVYNDIISYIKNGNYATKHAELIEKILGSKFFFLDYIGEINNGNSLSQIGSEKSLSIKNFKRPQDFHSNFPIQDYPKKFRALDIDISKGQ